jgi:hypothetical protein
MTTKQIDDTDPTLGSSVLNACVEAARRGLLNRSEGGHGHAVIWELSDLGRKHFTNRVVFKKQRYTAADWEAGKAFGSGSLLCSTWLASLPDTNEVCLQPDPSSKKQGS